MRRLPGWPRRKTGPQDPYSRVVSVFTLPERELRHLDVSLGPFRPAPGRRRPLIGRTRQDPGEPSLFESLCEVVVGTGPATAWSASRTVGDGRLDTFADGLVSALAEHNRAALRRREERPGDVEWQLDLDRELFRRWIPGVAWPRDGDGVPRQATLLIVTCASAREAEDRRQHLYCWSGPGFNPWTTKERIDRLAAKFASGPSDKPG